MKTFKLQVHSRSTMRYGPADDQKDVEDLCYNPRDYPDVKPGDIVEVYDVEDTYSRLLLQVQKRHMKDDYAHNTISVEDSIAKTFQLRPYRDVIVNLVNFKDVELDLLELTLKDQYFSRSDMWRYTNALTNSCAHLQKKFEHYCGRTTVYEMWAKGTRVACGTIGENTKVVYRSMSANVYIFIQMSAEMWEFDFYGDLYFEKSVKGFLTDLFDRWTVQGVNHDVTVVLFSRTFYDASDIHEFPCFMRSGLLRDYKGRFYEDFYRIVVQNEKYDDWTLVLIKLKILFHDYNETVLNFHALPGVKLPRGHNSAASEGNVLEVLNMGLNVFEKHTTDRNFERTGQMSIVITPSTGVLQVDRELLTLTKQKSIDYGIGNDLVFMGEQPLHVVPLFILHNKSGGEPVDYAIPNWLNYSYYTSKWANPNVFVPRIRIPEKVLQAIQKKSFFSSSEEAGTDHREFVEDFLFTTRQSTAKKTRSKGRTDRRLSESAAVSVVSHEMPTEMKMVPERSDERRNLLLSASLETANPLRPNAAGYLDLEDFTDPKRKSSRSPNPRQLRSLINPLAPSKIPVKLTSNRRRWVHIFPTDPSGAAVQTHHFRATSNSEDAQELSRSPVSDTARDTDSPHVKSRRLEGDGDKISSWMSNNGEPDDNSIAEEEGNGVDSIRSPRRMRNTRTKEDVGRGSPAPSGSQIWGMEPKKSTLTKITAWGITGEMEWTPNLTTGVDWKALTMPASLPITTDYLPDRRTLTNDYLISDYSVLPEETFADPFGRISREGQAENRTRYFSRPLGLRELYEELICQRLQQGFQLIVPGKDFKSDDYPLTRKQLVVSRSQQNLNRPEFTYLSLGRVIHKLTIDQSSITVTRFTPRHPYRIPCVEYLYRFMVPDMIRYEVSVVKFSHELLEHFNWNYVDFCVLTKGRGEFRLEHSMKYWKGQYFLLPCNSAIKKISEEEDPNFRCDIYGEVCPSECATLSEGFIKVVEIVNRLRRVAKNRRAENAARKAATGLKVLHRGANPSVMSNPDLQSAPNTPKVDSPLSNLALVDLQKYVRTIGVELEVAGSPLRSLPSVKAWLSSILENMRAPATGIIMQKQTDLPANCFVSFEAVEWAMEALQISHVEQTTDLFARMISEGLIVHASGLTSVPFIYGFYLYHIVDGRQSGDLELNNSDVDFNQVWIECAVWNPSRDRPLLRSAHSAPDFSKADMKFIHVEPPLNYMINRKKTSIIDVDMNHRSDRPEWAIAHYQATYTPKCAFEFELKWIQASGPMFCEMIHFWARKCLSSGFHLVPVSSDPFALPQKADSDPLRMPIFIPLNCACLVRDRDDLFQDLPEDSRYARVVLFQESILTRFGFMQLQENVQRTNMHVQSREYVHCSGGMFVMLPARDNKNELDRSVERGDCHTPSSRAEIGFWWAWNSCLTKKWRSSYTGDEAFLDRNLADFRRFCSNEANRLQEFWDSTCSAAQQPFSLPAPTEID